MKKPMSINAASLRQRLQVQIIPEIDSGGIHESVARWTIHGWVRKLLTIDPPSLDIGEGHIQGFPFRESSVSLTTHEPMVIKASCPEEFGHCKATRIADTVGDWRVNLQLAPSLTPGRLEFPITLECLTDVGWPTMVTIPVRGRIDSDISATPSSLPFGIQPIGEVKAEVILLRAKSKRRFVIQEARCSLGEIAIEVTGSDGGEKSIRVVLNSLVSGSRSGLIEVLCRMEDGSLSNTRVPCSYVGSGNR